MTQERIQGGATAGVDELYREVILDHFKKPKNRGQVPAANAASEGMNPLCGDQITITALVEGTRIKDVKFEGHGCAISQSAASMLTDLVKGKSVNEADDLTALYKKMFGIEDAAKKAPERSTDDLGDLISLEGVKKYPVRIKCAVLSANTLLQSLQPFLHKKGSPS